jgi:glucose-1-phosphate cytidylyltransferase
VKAVILAGGFGTRLSEETAVRPKPMVEIGGMPILWHILKIYSRYGIDDFVICSGYKGHYIKRWFADYQFHVSDVSFDFNTGEVTHHGPVPEPWRVSVIDTGYASMTGGRLRRVADRLDGETFCFTYGDAVADVDIDDLLAFHRREGRLATMTVVQPPGRFGAVSLAEDQTGVNHFMEKPIGDGSWINGGYFVLEPEVIDRIDGDGTVFEQEPLRSLARDGQLSAYRHTGFWQPLDTLRDKIYLEGLWESGEALWKIW